MKSAVEWTNGKGAAKIVIIATVIALYRCAVKPFGGGVGGVGEVTYCIINTHFFRMFAFCLPQKRRC